jgi:hypothetical protein
MVKFVLLGSAMIIAAPALAQTAPPSPSSSGPQAPVAQVPDRGAGARAPAGMATEALPPSSADVSLAAPAAAPASKAEQVAQVVDTEFPTYDKDSNGTLNAAEFASWMVALKTVADPTTKADSSALKTWVGQAFANADADQSKSVSKKELNGFLSQGG